MAPSMHTDEGIKCVLLVDPYYNGPSSMEIRREYLEPIARQFPEIQVIPYVIPGRTGTQLYHKTSQSSTSSIRMFAA